jgi:hypothetical protein
MIMTVAQLTRAYKISVTNTINYYNTLIRNVLKSRLPNATKTRNINKLKAQCQAALAALKKTYEAELIKLTKPPPALPTPALPTPALPVVALPTLAPLPPALPILAPPTLVKKKALLIGINYIGTSSQLNGCINDVNSLKTTLTTKYGFSADADMIKIITDETVQKPTRVNILAAFKQLLESGVEGDLLFFAFSGHGSSTFDANRDEVAGGKDEMIITSDSKGIVDDELKSLIQSYLKKNVTLFALFDCCFSGTVLDLKYQYLDSLDNDNSTVNSNEAETIGNVIMISGCNDNQTSADAYINAKYQGAMTWAFLSTLSESPAKQQLSWRALLTQMRDKLKTSKYEQLPQLSTGCFMDINKVICL